MRVRYQITATMTILDEQEWNATTTLETMHKDAHRSANIKISQVLKDAQGVAIEPGAIKVALIIVTDKERP